MTMTRGFLLRAMRVVSAVYDRRRAPARVLSSKYDRAGQRNVQALVAVLAVLAMAITATPLPAAADQALPLPRFASLRADKVYLRAGPGQSYPVDWVYTRKGMPVEIIAEYDQWRKIRDVDGTEGWVHRVMLSGMRTVLIAGALPHTAYGRPSSNGHAVFRAEPGVQGKLLNCDSGWCHIEVQGLRGWMPIGDLWGVYPEEAAGNGG